MLQLKKWLTLDSKFFSSWRLENIYSYLWLLLKHGSYFFAELFVSLKVDQYINTVDTSVQWITLFLVRFGFSHEKYFVCQISPWIIHSSRKIFSLMLLKRSLSLSLALKNYCAKSCAEIVEIFMNEQSSVVFSHCFWYFLSESFFRLQRFGSDGLKLDFRFFLLLFATSLA